MGKKRKVQEPSSYEVTVEESREPAAYTIKGDPGQQQQQQPQEQQEQHIKQEYQAGHDAGGYDYADGPQSYHHAGGPGGSRIDPDTLSYLTEVCEALSGMNDPDEAQLLRGNVLEEISGKELQLATDAASSTLMEQLLSGAPAAQLMQFMSAFTDGELLWRLAGAAFGSHVAEKVLAWIHAAAAKPHNPAAVDDGNDSSSADTAAALQDLEPLLESLVAAVEPHIVDYATDRHATHVARALLVVVVGRDVLTPPGKKQRQRQQQQQQQGGGIEGEDGEGASGAQHQQQAKGVFGRQRSSLAEKIQGSTAAAAGTAAATTRYPVLLRRLVKSLPLFDPQQMSALGKNMYGGPLLQAMLRASAEDQSLLMLLLPPILGLDPSKAAAAAPGQRLATLTDSSVGRLLRDDCYSHLLEVAVAVMPQTAILQGSAAPPAQPGLGAGEEEGLEGEGKKRKKRKVEGDDDGAAAGEEEEEEEQEQAAAAGKGLSLADEFYERFLRGRLLPLCCHHCANFVIQAVLSATHNKSRVAAYVTELSPHLGDLLRRRRSGVVAALAAAAARAGPGPHQQALVAALAAALGTLPQWQGRTGTAHLAPSLMTLDTQAVLGGSSGSSGSTTRLSTPGCAMLALLLGQFPAAVAAPFWESVGSLAGGDVLRAAKDPAGSRMLEAALVTPAVEAPTSKKKLRKLKKQQQQAGGDEAAAAAAADAGGDSAAVAARASLLSKLQGSWGSIVQVPAGSFLLEAVYNSMPADAAESLVAEVAACHDQLLSRCSWGPLVAKKLGLEAYLRSPEEWRKRAAAAATARREFQQLLATTGKHTKPAAAAAAANGDLNHQGEPQGEAGGVGGGHDAKSEKKREKKRRREQAGDGGAAAAADEAAADESNSQKRARLAAAALAAAEPPLVTSTAAAGGGGGEEAAADGSSKSDKKKKKRKLQQLEQHAAAGDDIAAADDGGREELGDKPPKKKAKKSKQQGADADVAAADVLDDGSKGKRKKKRARDSAGEAGAAAAVAAAGGGGGGVDLVALLGFGGLSADRQHGSSKKHKK